MTLNAPKPRFKSARTPIRTARTALWPVLLLAHVVSGQAATPIEDAGALARQGQHAAAEARYDRILAGDATMPAARIGRGYVRAWQKKFSGAAEDFRTVLAKDPKNLEAQNGLAYTLAWAGKHTEAEAEFRKSLAIAPGNFDAEKGLAYTALWRKDPKTATTRFSALAEKKPGDAELHVALGNAQSDSGDPAAARKSYERALAIDPARADARQGLDNLARQASASTGRELEVTAFAGRTDFGNGETKSGLRFAQVAVQATPSLRAWVQYDAGLALDNAALAKRNADANAYFIGGFQTWGGNLGTRVEIGRRDLGTGSSQTMLRTEQVFFLPDGITPKVGLWLGKGSGTSLESTLHAGVSVPVTKQFRVEPTIFIAKNVADERESRALLFGEYTFDNAASVGAGFAGGRKSNAVSSDARREFIASASLPVASNTRAMLQARRETGAGFPDNDLIAIGLAVRF
jgi:tetratricopeptide (TPR) repeat protein